MIFEFSPALHADVISITHKAPHGLKQMISRSDVLEIVSNLNRVLQQQEHAIYTTITKHYFELETATSLQTNSASPLIILLYVLSGTFSAYHEHLGNIRLHQGEYFLYYLPPGIHPMAFSQGNCTIMKVEVDLRMIATLADQHLILKQFHDHACESPDTGRGLPAMTTCREAKKALSGITNTKLQAGKRSMYMHWKVSMLLALYIDDLTRTKQAKTPRYTYTEQEIIILKQMAEELASEENRQRKLADIARKFGISYNKASQGFLWLFKKDMRTVRNEKIADDICRRLLETDKSIDQISVDMDFKETSSMRKLFKRYKGYSPLAYRLIHRRDHE